MIWKYFLFESKILFTNKKHLLIGLFIILFFPLFYFIQGTQDAESLDAIKDGERYQYNMIADRLPEPETSSPEVEQVRKIILEQISILGMQLWYIEEDRDGYIEEGLKLQDNKLRLAELNHAGIESYYIQDEADIYKDQQKLLYLQEHSDLPLVQKEDSSSDYMVESLNLLTSFILALIVLVSGSEILTFDQKHHSLTRGFPISFMKKAIVKIVAHFSYLFTAVLVGLMIGMFLAKQEVGWGYFNYPIVIFTDGVYQAIPLMNYIGLMIGAIALIILLMLALSILLNILFNHAFANILIGIALLFLPFVLPLPFLEAFLYINMEDVLRGQLAEDLNHQSLDYTFAMISLLAFMILLTLVIWGYQKIKVRGFDLRNLLPKQSSRG